MSGFSPAALDLSIALGAVAQVLWLWSWLVAVGAPALPARAIWVWPIVWAICAGSAWGLSVAGNALTKEGTQGLALAGGLISTLLARVLLVGVPLLMCFFAAASVMAATAGPPA